MINYCKECEEEVREYGWVMACGFLFCCMKCMKAFVKREGYKHKVTH